MMNRDLKQHLLEIEIFRNIINAFIVTFDQFNASLQNDSFYAKPLNSSVWECWVYLYSEVMSLQVTISCCSNQVMLTVLEDFCWPGADRRTIFCNILTYNTGQHITNLRKDFFSLPWQHFHLATIQTI